MNTVITHPDQPEMQAEVILASRCEDHPDLVTMRLRYPRIIHGEINTHREFSRNARSSRAVPVQTILNEVHNTPFVPWHWGANQKGMQAGEECHADVWNQLVQMPLAGSGYGHPLDWEGEINEKTGVDREDAWLMAAERAVQSAEAFMEAGYHKQIVNRLLEPFSWIDTLITTTSWDNFFWLRDHKDAEPHLQDLARLTHQALNAAEYRYLEPGGWHLPYITDKEYWEFRKPYRRVETSIRELCKLSAARCARISYKPFDGDASYEKELARYESLVSSDRVHASPLEHQATPDTKTFYSKAWDNRYLHGNLKGWIQFRKTIKGEYHG